MNLRIVHVDVHQAGLLAGVLYAILGLLALPFVLLASMSSGQTGQPSLTPGFAVALPILYGVVGYVGTALVCWLFNRIARRLGGITLSFTEAGTGPS